MIAVARVRANIKCQYVRCVLLSEPTTSLVAMVTVGGYRLWKADITCIKSNNTMKNIIDGSYFKEQNYHCSTYFCIYLYTTSE